MDCINKTTSFSIQKAAVIGAGTMGAGIAALVADAGIPVILLDIVPPKLTEEDVIKGVDTKSRTFRDRFAQGGKERVCDPKRGTIYDPEHATLITVGNLEDDLELLRDCDWVVEVIIEDLKAKQDLLEKIRKNDREGKAQNGLPARTFCQVNRLEQRRKPLWGSVFWHKQRPFWQSEK